MTDLNEIKDINADLPLTNFPDEIDDLESFSDADDEINSAIITYKNLMKQGETAKAEELYEKYSLKKYIVSAYFLNKIQHMIIACERSISSVKKYFSFSTDAPTGTTSQPNGYLWGKVLQAGDYFKKVILKLKENGKYVDIYPQTTADNVLITEGETETVKDALANHTHLYAGSNEPGGVANSSCMLKSSWSNGKQNMRYYSALDDNYTGSEDYNGMPLERIVCAYPGEDVSDSNNNFSEKDWLLHPVRIGDILDYVGIGKHIYKSYSVDNSFNFSVFEYNDGYGDRIPLVLPPGSWLIINRIWTESLVGRYLWSTVAKDMEGNTIGLIGYHAYDKTIEQGAYQEIQCVDFVVSTVTSQIIVENFGCPSGYNDNGCTMFLHAMKIR